MLVLENNQGVNQKDRHGYKENWLFAELNG
jgi:hypothetical protein